MMAARVPLFENPVSTAPGAWWAQQTRSLHEFYKQNRPIPHILIKDFLDPDIAGRAMKEFPAPSTESWTHYEHQNENKLGMTDRVSFPPILGQLVDQLNSHSFVSWLSELTGIPGLESDTSLEGAGLHQSVRGGFLNVHTDFSHHHYRKNWRRRINLILYLNEGWKEEWGGAIELWDEKMRTCEAKYPPLFNHVLIFNTDAKSFHGFPEPLSCPPGASRKSLALYYYTADDSPKPAVRSTDYRSRPNDGLGKSLLIWLDKQAVNLYSKAKARLGFSDRFASRILSLLSRRK